MQLKKKIKSNHRFYRQNLTISIVSMHVLFSFSETMRVCYRLPWRRVKAVVPILIVAALVLYLQPYFFDSLWQQKTNVKRLSDVQSEESRFHHLANLGLPSIRKETSNLAPDTEGGTCPCSGSYKPSADIYTYTLPDVTNYTLDKDREYFIPDPRKDIVKRKTCPNFNLEPVQVILVPFSHADPGYGNTMEGYYSSSTKSKSIQVDLINKSLCSLFSSYIIMAHA